ncbi:PQQ-dependent sugar dehydrogenase [Nostoc sphaeroides CHAB 2801]|uniref:PA14 domain-containing protein n=1 Tax=Nostoc sphaeroides TaxID=446679 RepID=UPI001E58FD6E|nr:PA14 domain-containing protein [Nostoc sphaeroides]MCC5630952.1 PQQ-dependent sugar dehydrogenase [Nostoc sphaeroides CHAB 2801]
MTDSQNQQLSTSPSQIINAQSSLQSIDQAQPSISASASVLSQGDGLKAEYYDNIDFTNLKQTRTDPTVNFSWGLGSPDRSIGVDTFSARWTGQVEAKYSETYNFYTSADDGVRLWVNGEQIINKFVNQSATEHSGAIALVAGQKYDIKLEYYENKYDAVSRLAWSSFSQTKEIIPQSQLYSNVNTPSNGNGLKAEYYDNIDFTNLKQTRIDSTVNFSWGLGSPDPSIGVDTFSARWTGQVEAKYSETYNFYTTADDGVRLWVNGEQIINKFVNQSATEHSGAIALVAGQKYDIKLEYYENKYDAVSRLAWSSFSQTKEIIPQSQLYSPDIQTIITLGSSSTTVNEGDGTVTLTVLRSGDLRGTSSIKYATQSATAKVGNDYGNAGEEVEGTLTFAPGQISKQVAIRIIDDNLIETDEAFSFLIDQPEGATLGTQRTFGITIKDNDGQSLNFTQLQVNENVGNATVTVTRTNGLGTASVNYTTVDGTAKADSDYQALSGTLTFAQGETSKNILIPIKDDTIQEANEAFTLMFSNAVGMALPNNPAADVVILNDDLNFHKNTLVSGLEQPTEFDWSADNKLMFIAQKDGIVKVFNSVTNSLEAQPFIDISSQVNNVNDRGLLGMAVHPDFGKSPNGNNYIYLLFTYDPVETNANHHKNNHNSNLDNPDQGGNRAARLVRVEADPNTSYKTAISQGVK